MTNMNYPDIEGHNAKIVIVLDLGNYKASAQEPVPFKAMSYDLDDTEIIVQSIATGRQYEVYPNQVLETLSDAEIASLINLKNYGNYE